MRDQTTEARQARLVIFRPSSTRRATYGLTAEEARAWKHLNSYAQSRCYEVLMLGR